LGGIFAGCGAGAVGGVLSLNEEGDVSVLVFFVALHACGV
jgi:hypothetical protein